MKHTRPNAGLALAPFARTTARDGLSEGSALRRVLTCLGVVTWVLLQPASAVSATEIDGPPPKRTLTVEESVRMHRPFAFGSEALELGRQRVSGRTPICGRNPRGRRRTKRELGRALLRPNRFPRCGSEHPACCPPIHHLKVHSRMGPSPNIWPGQSARMAGRQRTCRNVVGRWRESQ